MMQRSVWQKQAQFGIARGNSRKFYLRRHQDDGAPEGCKQRFRFRRDISEPASDIKVSHHDRERFLFAVLALAQRANGRSVVRVAGEMVAANAFDGNDASVPEQLSSRPDRQRRRRLHMILRSTIGTSDRLRVEAAT